MYHVTCLHVVRNGLSACLFIKGVWRKYGPYMAFIKKSVKPFAETSKDTTFEYVLHVYK